MNRNKSQELVIGLLIYAGSKNRLMEALKELFSEAEIENMFKRIEVTTLLVRGKNYRQIQAKLHTSSYLIDRAKRNFLRRKGSFLVEYLKSLGYSAEENGQ